MAVRLLVLEDFGFRANGGIETVITSLVRHLASQCEELIWVLPEYKMALAARRIGGNYGIKIVSLQPPRWQFGRYVTALASRLAKYSKLESLENIHTHLLQRAQHKRLNAVIRTYKLSHLLNLGVFDQPFPEVDIPVWGIVYDTNYALSWRDKCLNNLSDWAKRADGIFSISNWAREQIVEADSLAKEKIYMVPLAVPDQQPCTFQHVKHEKGCPVFLYPASFNSHKNHSSLLKALSLLDKEGYDFKMIFCGFNTDQMLSLTMLRDNALEAARAIIEVATPCLKERIDALGMVDQQHLERLFQQASLVLLPTTYEGFGLPLVEAVARGVPVLCSDIPPFREQVRLYELEPYVTFVNGFDEISWARAIKMAGDQASHTYQSSQSIRKSLDKWTWKDVAGQYLKLMRYSSRNHALAKS